MRDLRNLLRLPVSLLLCLPIHPTLLTASPSIDVTLQASFPAPPFLLELLETAAAENSSSYFPLLDTIATGRFSTITTDAQLYTQFLQTLQNERHITDPSALSTFKLALAVHEAAPRIEAHYQFWRTSGQHAAKDGAAEHHSGIEIWRHDGKLCRDVRCEETETVGAPSILGRSGGAHTQRQLAFDRVSGEPSSKDAWTLYIDPTSADFATTYTSWRGAHSSLNPSFRVRYQPPARSERTPLVVNGYGIELALKRTDYIVIDDRQGGEDKKDGYKQASAGAGEVNLEDEDVADLKPLSSSELLNLGINAASFIMESEHPLDTLVKVTQDFPKHAAALALHEAHQNFIAEHNVNREELLPAGYNVLWINGMQMDPRKFDAFSLLDHLRRERKMIGSVQDLGLTAGEAISLLSHDKIAEAIGTREPQRYDWRDEYEGGGVILWLNDLEKDKRYAQWPTNITSLLQRSFPGQLPSVRKDIQNIIFPIDFTDRNGVGTVAEMLQSLVKRQVAVRFGIVPKGNTQAAVNQAKTIYYLNEAYGLAAVMSFLEDSLVERKIFAGPSDTAFAEAAATGKLRRDQEALSLEDVLKSETYTSLVKQSQHYLRRLGADGPNAPLFVNGVPIPFDDDWLQVMSQRVGADLMVIQQGVYEGRYTQDMWLPEVFLDKATVSRNPLVIPEDESSVRLFDISKLFAEHPEEMNALLLQDSSSKDYGAASLIVVGDLNTRDGAELALNAIDFSSGRDDIVVAIKHQCTSSQEPGLSAAGLGDINNLLLQERPNIEAETKGQIQQILQDLRDTHSKLSWPGHGQTSPLVTALGLQPGTRGLLLNGRLIVLPDGTSFQNDDFDTLLAYERKKRIDPAVAAVEALGLREKIATPQSLAQLSSLIALSTVSDVPEGIYENQQGPRLSIFNKWEQEHTCIEIGDKTTATLQVSVSLDPSSELAQRWVPMLQLLAGLEGTYTRIWLNPKEKLEELPVKRFYRQVIDSKPAFDANGLLQGIGAHFTGIPREALLTMTMDTPPSWLVAPKESVYDLDNIKLSSVQGDANVEAIYELENILVEGHSRDTTGGQPPRGVQLVLGTEIDPNFASTIIMANLGYFQFKANPGVYSLALQAGRSKEIFNIDSAGTYGYDAQSENTTEISLISFQGATLFPRLSRKVGKEVEDVLEDGSSLSAEAILSKGAELADSVLSKVGLPKGTAQGYLSKAMQVGHNILASTGLGGAAPLKKHADINIFSVASGHLYERMLNIMMVSVMRHTKHTVKFWFIEQFLSPSFKEFLPTMATEYGFEFEMVTYKWPHWLRAQKEKQRVIWGYKILFLDVLFPLDLDKVIFVDADQIVRTDMYELVSLDLNGAPYGFTPMCDSRTEMEGFRFWKQGYWKQFLRGLPYHISALYVVDLARFRQLAAGDRLRGQYHQLSADPASLSNLDQDLPNHMQMMLPIFSLPQDWLWCETWCSDEALTTAKTIDLCNNPLTKEPKLDRARRQVPEWTVYDDEIAALARRERGKGNAAGSRVETAEEREVGEEKSAERTRDEL